MNYLNISELHSRISNHEDFEFMNTVLAKRSTLSVSFFVECFFLKVLNDTKLILNDQLGLSDSFMINLVSFRTFRGPVLH